MKLFDFLRNLTASFTKDEVKEKLRLVIQSLHDTIAAYVSSSEVLGKSGYKSKAGKDFDAAFKRTVKVPFRGTFAEVIQQVLTNMDSFADQLSGLIDKSYNKDIVVEGITYKRAEILRTLGFMDFAVTYATQVLHYILAAEANVQAKTLVDGKERPKPELDWLAQNQDSFFRLLNTFGIKGNDLFKAIENIPDITVGENDDLTIVPSVGIVRLDPLKNNFIPGVTPMFIGIGTWWAQRQVQRYERMKEDHKLIAYRIEQLRLQAQGKEDPQLEKTIAKYEQFLNELAEDIAKMEKKYK